MKKALLVSLAVLTLVGAASLFAFAAIGLDRNNRRPVPPPTTITPACICPIVNQPVPRKILITVTVTITPQEKS